MDNEIKGLIYKLLCDSEKNERTHKKTRVRQSFSYKSQVIVELCTTESPPSKRPYFIELAYKLSAFSRHKLSVTMASKKETRKKKNYREAEIDVLLMEEQMRAKTLFESLSGGVMAKAKYEAW